MERFTELEKRYVGEVLENGFRTSLNSMFCKRLEDAFAELLGRRYAISLVNGTATLHTALAAAEVGPGDEVIVPPLTMASTALAVLHNGSVPVFADVDRRTFNLSPDSIREKITGKTRAVIPVALYGLAPDYDGISNVCRPKNISVIEDDAEAVLSAYKGKLVGQFGEFASFSFQASKHLTCGEGGMLVTDDEKLADRARRFSCLGYAGVAARKGKITRTDIQDPRYSRHICLGWNYRMSELQAAVALGQVERVRDLVAVRVRAAQAFDKVVRRASWLIPQEVPEGYSNSYWTYAVILGVPHPEQSWYKFRDLFAKNGGDGIYAACKLTYREPLFQEIVRHYPGIRQDYQTSLCPNAEYLQPRLLQFKTNYWDEADLTRQVEILEKTIRELR